MSQRIAYFLSTFVGLLCALGSQRCARAESQHLWWKTENHRDATCVYGEITPLATHPSIYYCGANWRPGEPAGGYCGIQHNSFKERRTIFSIWDTKPTLRPKIVEADAKTLFNRFGGEGEGAHTHMLCDWQAGRTFQFFVEKQPGDEPSTTATRYYIFEPDQKKWLHSATILSPNGDAQSEKSVAKIGGGGLASFLENINGKEPSVPKLALYRLWLGNSPEQMKCLTEATGDGHWGQLHDAYFLAEGGKEQLAATFASLEPEYGRPIFGEKRQRFPPISDKPAPVDVMAMLKHLPHAAAVSPAPAR